METRNGQRQITALIPKSIQLHQVVVAVGQRILNPVLKDQRDSIPNDPVITNKTKIKKRTHANIPVEALQSLKLSSLFNSSSEEDEEAEMDDDTDSD
ncbi:hypothetical protein JTB14_006684 [Gonioctena quinquepunctata]|nr:hypothetical protein JTB14_006684 [Gonioctena quinquepunctata]